MSEEGVMEQLAELEEAVRRASEVLNRLRDENARLKDEHAQLKREITRLGDERRQVVSQIDAILKDIGKLELGTP
jgi:septal ring factor EnvC (AmiA/AmiB activator)